MSLRLNAADRDMLAALSTHFNVTHSTAMRMSLKAFFDQTFSGNLEPTLEAEPDDHGARVIDLAAQRLLRHPMSAHLARVLEGWPELSEPDGHDSLQAALSALGDAATAPSRIASIELARTLLETYTGTGGAPLTVAELHELISWYASVRGAAE